MWRLEGLGFFFILSFWGRGGKVFEIHSISIL
jgi:hypothetical protein